FRYADLAGLPSAAHDLVRLNVDVIVGGGTPATLAAKHLTNTIPIVGAVMADPIADGLVVTLARPATNVTGNTFLAPALGLKSLQLLREAIPTVTRMAVLQHPGVYGEATMRNMRQEIETEARASGADLQVMHAQR